MNFVTKLSQFAEKTFALWVIVFGFLAFMIPSGFIWIGPFISILLGIIMFGMGMTLTLGDFKEIGKQPISVIIGVVLQFTVMPLIAYGLAKGLSLPPEIAVGVILVGARSEERRVGKEGGWWCHEESVMVENASEK